MKRIREWIANFFLLSAIALFAIGLIIHPSPLEEKEKSLNRLLRKLKKAKAA
jgi:hypothetical protein